MKGNCTKLERYNGTGWDTVSNRTSISGPALTRETVEKELTLDCTPEGGSDTKKKSPGTKEIGDVEVETIWNPVTPTGTHQVTTATGAGTVTGAGNASITVTSAILPTSPLVIPVAVTTGAPSVWVPLVRAALAEHSAISAFYSVGGTGSAITLTTLEALVNDATLNVAIATGNATGITTAATSAATTAGVLGESNTTNHHLFLVDYDRETATFWRIRHPNSAATGEIVHATVKECGAPEFSPNQDVKRSFTLEPTGEFYVHQNNITAATLPIGLIAPSDHWGSDD